MEMHTWESLGTFAGASAATLLLVQYLKLPLDKLVHIPTRLVVLVVAFLILLAAHAFGTGRIDVRQIPLLFLNAVLVSLSAMGAYEASFSKAASQGERADAFDDQED